MACFLIDYENETGRALEGLSLFGLNKNDEIIIFYSRRTGRITMELHQELEKIKSKKLYVKVETGQQNALDFQLSSYLGACIHQNPKKEYYIVSQDVGYDCVCNFWKSKKVFVQRIDNFCHYAV